MADERVIEPTRRIDTGEVSLAVYESGPPDAPAIVLLHGLSTAHGYVTMRSRILERRGYRVIGYDARGHGRSSRPADPTAYDYDDLTRDLAALLEALALDHVLLVGASMGCHTALRYALDHPGRVAGVGVITPAYDPVGSFEPAALERWDMLRAALRDGGPDGFVAAYGRPPELDPWADQFDWALRLVRQRFLVHEDLEGVLDAWAVIPRSRPYAQTAELADLPCPAFVLGTTDVFDREHPLWVAEKHATALGVDLLVEELGRLPWAWSGARVSRFVTRFADEIGYPAVYDDARAAG